MTLSIYTGYPLSSTKHYILWLVLTGRSKPKVNYLEFAETEVSLIARILIFFHVPADVTKRPNAKNENYAFWNS